MGMLPRYGTIGRVTNVIGNCGQQAAWHWRFTLDIYPLTGSKR